MAPIRKRSKLWNYFEELGPSLVKCRKCKKEIHISCPNHTTRIFRAHLNEHVIFHDNPTLPDDLRQYYSELPGYKARCDCGQTVSFLAGKIKLRQHLERHFTRTQSRDKAITMVPIGKRSKLWNYFEELKPSLVKCRRCKKEIQIPHQTKHTKIFRTHLSGHGIFSDNGTRTLPDDLRQHYSELPGYRAKCNDCGQTFSFLHHNVNLRKHLTRHFTRTQSRDKAITMVPIGKRSKLWNYFEELKPSLVKCRRCKKEIHIRNPASATKIFRTHLSGHGIFPDNDTRTLPDDLRQYYSELPGCKARCNDCGRTVSFLNGNDQLRSHLRRHSIRIQSRYKTFKKASRKKRSILWDYFEEVEPSLIKCKKCKKEIRLTYPNCATGILRAHLSRHAIFPDSDIHKLPDNLRQYYSELSGYKAKCNDCNRTLSFLNNYVRLRIHLRRHSTRIRRVKMTRAVKKLYPLEMEIQGSDVVYEDAELKGDNGTQTAEDRDLRENEVAEVRTRSGRIVREPSRFEYKCL